MVGRRPPAPITLPDDVVLSVQGLKRAAAPPEAELPPWLARVLPKSGIAGQAGGGVDDEELDFLDEDGEEAEPTSLAEISFDLRAGHGLGVLGLDSKARDALLRVLVGAVPPTSGHVVVRGRLASLHRRTLVEYAGVEWGRKAVFVVARMFHWPRPLLRERWEEIEAFARGDELKHLSTRKFRLQWTARLLLSAAMHMDASVYVIDHTVHSDADFAARMFDVLAERKREGAAIVQGAQKMVEDVARLCEDAMWLEDGAVLFSGSTVQVAIDVHKHIRPDLHPLSEPVSAALADEQDVITIGGDGGALEIDLTILRKQLEIGLALELSDPVGDTLRLEQPEPYVSEEPGIYKLRVVVPGGLLKRRKYEAKLIREVAVLGGEPGPPAELLRFALESNGTSPGAEDMDDDVTFTVPDDVDDRAIAAPDEVEWHVSRTTV